MFTLLATLSIGAHAGSGPWALSRGDSSVYVAVEAYRFTKLAPVMGGELQEATPGGPVQTTGVKAGATIGIVNRVEAELTVPYYRVEASVTGPGACTDFPDEACETTMGLGIVELKTKWQFADELAGSPLSLAIAPLVRFGAHTSATRHRITNLGEGTTDLGLILTAGRAAPLGGGLLSSFLEAGYLHRPATQTEPRAPSDELFGTFSLQVGTRQGVSIGPVVSSLWRPRGLDFDTVDLNSADRFAMIRVFNARAGGGLTIRDPESGTALHLSFLQTVAARNNPSDTWFLLAALSAHNPFHRAESGT